MLLNHQSRCRLDAKRELCSEGWEHDRKTLNSEIETEGLLPVILALIPVVHKNSSEWIKVLNVSILHSLFCFILLDFFFSASSRNLDSLFMYSVIIWKTRLTPVALQDRLEHEKFSIFLKLCFAYEKITCFFQFFMEKKITHLLMCFLPCFTTPFHFVLKYLTLTQLSAINSV